MFGMAQTQLLCFVGPGVSKWLLLGQIIIYITNNLGHIYRLSGVISTPPQAELQLNISSLAKM